MAIYESEMIATDKLAGGPEVHVLTANYPVAAGTALKRGTLVTIGDDGKAAATIKTGVASAIVANDIDAKATVVTCYTSGRFNANALIVASGDTVDAHAEELKKVGIYLTTSK